MLISTLVLKENLLDKSQNRPPKNTGPVIHCWHSTLSSCTSLVSSLPLSHSTLPSTAPESSKPHLKSKSCCNISLYTSVSTKKKTLCILDPCQMVMPLHVLWSHFFLLRFTIVHMVQNAITIIWVHYHISLKNSLSAFYYLC